jgi:fluoride exporter
MDQHRRPAALGAMALGGGLGTAARYGVTQVIHAAPGSFPWPTFWTNVSGSFALGVVLGVVLPRFPPKRYLRPFVAVGFLGAYTTYSTFAVETVLLVRDGRTALGLVYAAASLAAGFAMAGAGVVCARHLRVNR